ncbi:glutamate-rich protein 6-like isoform X2 [Scyliorhinus canicula]|uniref:glutamate-rich protein 6-like isoform X2 n=1 Tax=Scyliorhinus canicula TaxID=7830 RepID=UPI0018F685AA|nr:glutamate-rich protein 6-like isoform X2 [Scyliorhinus canicula]
MSEEHRSANENGVEEDQLSFSAEPTPGHTTSEVVLGQLQEPSGTDEELALERSAQDDVTQIYGPSERSSQITFSSNLVDWNAEVDINEPVSVVNSAQQISSEASRSTIEEVIGVLNSLSGSEADSELSLQTTLSSNTLRTSETERKYELPGAARFTSDNSHSLTTLQGEGEHQREFKTVDTQTIWVSWNTPATSEMELRPVISKIGEEGGEEPQKTSTEQSKSIIDESDFEDIVIESSSEVEEERQKLTINTTSIVFCEFCSQIRLPFPTPNILDTKGPEECFCCNMSWMLYQQILKGRAENPNYLESETDHTRFTMTEEELIEAREKLTQRAKNTEVLMYMSYVVYGDKVTFTHLKTISYRLSSEYCKKQGWTLRPLPVLTKPEDLSIFIPSAESYKEPKRPPGIVEKYYSDGQKFLTRFPDGTGNVFYPSGNIAIVISAFHRGQFVYLIFQDMDWNAKFLGLFRSNGHGTCYLPNGLIRINVTPSNGFYFTEQGLNKNRWLWRDCHQHVHAPPYLSINLELNSQISIRLISRGQIYTTFKTRKRGVRINMGAKLILKDIEQFHTLESGATKEEMYLKRMSQKIQGLLDLLQYN